MVLDQHSEVQSPYGFRKIQVNIWEIAIISILAYQNIRKNQQQFYYVWVWISKAVGSIWIWMNGLIYRKIFGNKGVEKICIIKNFLCTLLPWETTASQFVSSACFFISDFCILYLKMNPPLQFIVVIYISTCLVDNLKHSQGSGFFFTGVSFYIIHWIAWYSVPKLLLIHILCKLIIQ